MDAEVVAKVLRDYDNCYFNVKSSNNKLIKAGDFIQFSFTREPFNDSLYDYVKVEIVNRELCKGSNLAWKFADCNDLANCKEFDDMDWREELDDIRNLAPFNFFHYESFEKLLSSIELVKEPFYIRKEWRPR